jgi:hypothetical protein
MKITREDRTRPLVTLTSGTSGSGGSGGQVPPGQVIVSNGSNGGTSWSSNVAIITANGSNQLTGPFVNFQSGSGISFSTSSNTLTISATGGGSGSSLPWFDVQEDYGAAGDGVTDDTAEIQAAIDAAAAAGGGVVYFRKGVYVVGGALTDTSRSNSQLTLPSVNYVAGEQITIHLLGEVAPPPIFSVIGAAPLPDEHVVIKGTLNVAAGTSPSLLGGWGPDTSEDFTFILARIENIAFRLPENPQLTALNLSHVAAVELDNVLCDVSDYQIQGITEPTTAASYGIMLPGLNNGALTHLGTVNVAGYYNGIQVGEHTIGENVSLWGCKRAIVTVAGYHASHFDRLMTVHCERGIVGTGGTAYLSVDQFNVEHAASGWWVTDYDVDDASNYLVGRAEWKVTLAGVGHDSTWTTNGAANFLMNEMGDAPGIDYGEDADISDLAFDDVADAGGLNEVARADHVHGMPAEPTGGSTGAILLESGHAVPFTFDEILQESDGSDFLYASE